MKKFIFAFIVFFASVCPGFSQIKLDKTDRVENVSPDKEGYCAWCCISTLARHHGIKSLYDLKEKRTKASDFRYWDQKTKRYVEEPYVWVNDNGIMRKTHRAPGDWVDMLNKLNEAKVKYKVQNVGNFDKEIIKYAIWNKLGCMIVVKDWSGQSNGTHAMIIQTYSEKEVTLFDPNHIDSDYSVTWDWIDRWWTGYVLILEKQ